MAGKGPLNYTTTIDPAKTAGECMGLLAKHGAAAIGFTYKAGSPTGLTFSMSTVHGPRQYSLSINVDGTFTALNKAARMHRIPPRYSNDREQAARVAWRVIKDWLEAQLALIEAGVAEMEQVLLPYMHVGSGPTVYELFVANEQALELEAAE